MIDPVGIRPVASVGRAIAAVAPAPAVQPAPAVSADESAGVTSELQALAQPAAASPPIDVERVAKIRRAIEDGKFPLIPSTIADRLIAFRLQWNPNEPA